MSEERRRRRRPPRPRPPRPPRPDPPPQPPRPPRPPDYPHAWVRYRNDWPDPCPMCEPFIGLVFLYDDRLPLPAHPNCRCYYTFEDDKRRDKPDPVNWDRVPEASRSGWVRFVAWMLRNGWIIPPILVPLIPDAEAYNEEREEEGNPPMPPPPEELATESTESTEFFLSPPSVSSVSSVAHPENPMHRLKTTVYSPPARVDREQHIIYGVSAMQAVEALGHGFAIDATSLGQLVTLGNGSRHGVKSRFTHPGLSADGLGKFLGRMRNFRQDGDKAVADLYLADVASRSPAGDLRSYVEDLAEEDPEAFGMSAVLTGDSYWILDDGAETAAEDTPRPKNAIGKTPVLRIVEVHAIDAVDEPAANRNGMFSAVFDKTTSSLAEHIYQELDNALPRLGYGPYDLPDLIQAFYRDQNQIPQPLRSYGQYLANTYDVDEAKAQSFAHSYIAARRVRPNIISLATESTENTERMSYKLQVASGKPSVSSVNSVAQPAQGGNMEPENPLIDAAAAEEALAAPVVAHAPEQPAAGVTIDAWQQALAQSAGATMLANSGLPEPVRRRLARRSYATPHELQLAIKEAKDELAELEEANVIDLGLPPSRRVITAGHMRHSLDDASDLINWLFGVDGAPLPEPAMRRADAIYRLLTGDIHWYGTFDSVHALASANPTTLPGLAVNAMNKVIIGLWDTLMVYRWFEPIVTVQPNDGSLHDMQWIQFGGLSNLDEVSDGAAYVEKTVDDSKEADAFVKYGNYVGITRKMLRNSEIARIQAVPRALAVAAVRTRSNKIASIFTSNAGVGPTMDEDSKALFHNDHANLATTAYSWTAWKAARLQCFKQTELGSAKVQGLWPRFGLFPPDLYDDALVDFGYGAGTGGKPGTANNDVNPYAESRVADPRAVPIPVPEFTDTNDWAWLTDPAINPVIQMSYSQNPSGRVHPMPELFSVASELAGLMFTNDTMPIKVRDEFAYGVATYRGIGKRNVA